MSYYTKHVFCCTNQRPEGHKRGCCATKNSEKLQNYMKSRLKEKEHDNKEFSFMRINKAGCLDRCEYGPVLVVYPDNIWYQAKTTEDIDEILESHLKNNIPVQRLMLPEREKEQ